MNGRGFHDWYAGELRRNGSPAAMQVPAPLANFPGNSLGLLNPQTFNQPQNPIGMLSQPLMNFYQRQLTPQSEQQPSYSANPHGNYLPNMMPHVGTGAFQL